MKPLTVLIIGSLHPPVPDPKAGAGNQVLATPATDAASTPNGEQAFKHAQAVFAAQEPQFQAACKALGAAFARRSWHIMVGTPSWQALHEGHTVASFVVQGASSAPCDGKAAGHRIIFYAPRDTEPADATPQVTDTLQELQALPNLDLRHRLIAKGEYKAKVIPNITDVDAVLLVAGADGTASIGYAAYSLDRPVVAITGLGGAAWTLYDDVLAATYDRYKEAVALDDSELRALGSNWKPDAEDVHNRQLADKVVLASEKIVQGHGLARRQTTRVLGWSMAGMAALLVLWVAVYLMGAAAVPAAPASAALPHWAPAVASAPLLTPSAAHDGPGTAADTASASSPAPPSAPASAGNVGQIASVPGQAKPAQALAGGKSADPPPGHDKAAQPLLADAQSGRLPVAFFALLYISAAVGTGLRVLVAFQSSQIARLTLFAVGMELAIATSVAFGLALFYLIGGISFTGKVVALHASSETFATIAVSMSLLGLAAGYLVPLDRLREKLQKIFATDK